MEEARRHVKNAPGIIRIFEEKNILPQDIL